ncbi:DNA-binding protein [Spirosoma aureum]|uniref:DNA-binding protein n=1 Tax=Spirosoma aureum TaxID=2692134 RepID=A0A6G9AMP2_9BACT|nr:glycosyl hydrolase [Spirosoma aureum]QIP13609.1 DNA-binding protein [Spirosoma aureum]
MINANYCLRFFAFFISLSLWLADGKSLAQLPGGLAKIVPPAKQSANAKPWVFWYWMQGGVSKEGITADLEAMKETGIGGAYLMPIKGVTDPPLYTPATAQLSPRWWDMVRFTMQEAKRLGLEMGMHVSDGFALAGGPWITPALSMQKVVYASMQVQGNQAISVKLPQPPANEGYYKDIAVLAFPSFRGSPDGSNESVQPKITSSKPGVNPQFLIDRTSKESFKSDTACWIQYAFDQPFTCRSVLIRTGGNNYQAQRLQIEVSNDGKTFRPIERLEPPRHGWQDTDADVTHAITPTTARYFRFVYDKAGSEPGAEDLDAAKWKPGLKLIGLELSAEPRINQFEGKSAIVWRVGKRAIPAVNDPKQGDPANLADQSIDKLAIPLSKVINLTDKLTADGHLNWNAPAGSWTIMRIGHTSTGHTNATAGAGKGLECDKFNSEAISLQFTSWFGEAQRQIGPELSKNVLKVFHVDSWECGSQNWSSNFASEFKKRRGYELTPYLPVIAGIPIESVEVSEQVLYDIRRTVADLIVDVFYKTLADLAHENGVTFTAESVAPTMTSDGLAHYKRVDVPMGEFWLNSPTHDKPNDMLDAVSAAHIYGKNIVQAEGFTTVRMAWDEHPGMLKTLQDRNYALGINKLVYHVFTHNPWLDRKPGMTLDGVGLYFQRDQTWWKSVSAWVDYARRCQTLLQIGKPVADIAVFTGEDIPRRAVLPDRLVSTLPGIFGKEVVKKEAKRLANAGEPLRQKPAGVTHSANMADPENWVDPLRGYAYDSFSPDALNTLANMQGGRVSFAPGTAYSLLVLPDKHPLNMNNRFMTPETAARFLKLVNEGAMVLVGEKPIFSAGKGADKQITTLTDQLWGGSFDQVSDGETSFRMKRLGKGRVIQTPYQVGSFEKLGLSRDVDFTETTGEYARNIAWTHRTDGQMDLYFIANQEAIQRDITVSFRQMGRAPELYNAVTDELTEAKQWSNQQGRTQLSVRLEPNSSLFVLFRKPAQLTAYSGKNWTDFRPVKTLEGSWEVQFDTAYGGPKQPQTFAQLTDWSQSADSSIRYYSGTATYSKIVNWAPPSATSPQRFWLDLGNIANIADVKLNGVSCGVAWTAPYRIEITHVLKTGENRLTIDVSNTWANRLIGDQLRPESRRITRTTAPFRLQGKPLLKAGLLGPVQILVDAPDQSHK